MQSLHNIIEITHPHNVNSKLVFHKVVSFHQHYSTFTLQTYHHPEHRFRSWPTHMISPSHIHTQARVQPRNTYNHTYIKFLPGQKGTLIVTYKAIMRPALEYASSIWSPLVSSTSINKLQVMQMQH